MYGRTFHIVHNQTGLSLTEVLVAAALLGIALLPIAYVESTGVQAGGLSYGVNAAAALAVDLKDKINSIPYTDTRLAATSGYVAPDSTLSSANPLGPNGATMSQCGSWTVGTIPVCGYARTIQVTANTPIANAKQIDVRVQWKEYGFVQTFTISTIKAVGS